MIVRQPRNGSHQRRFPVCVDGAVYLGTMVQEAYDTHPAIREACDRYISEHAARLHRKLARDPPIMLAGPEPHITSAEPRSSESAAGCPGSQG